MKQLYALIEEESFHLHNDKFPDAVIIGKFRLGVFVDSEVGKYEGLKGVKILTYEQAKAFSSEHKNAP